MFNPFQNDIKARLVEEFLGRPLEDLPPKSVGAGAGVYGLFYIGKFPAYSHLSEQFKDTPIYIGKAVAPGGRKGAGDKNKSNANLVVKRLNEHAKTIRQAKNLDIADFRCRWLFVVPEFVNAAEAILIDHFNSIWNRSISGFGIHTPGKGRRKQARSDWDTLHPGREFANGLPDGNDLKTIVARIKVQSSPVTKPQILEVGNAKQRYLTKSRFKIGTECPTKLYYLDQPQYGNKNVDDTFLRGLAEGGFQVGELAKLYHPSGTEVSEISHKEAVEKTKKLLGEKDVTIFEAALSIDNLFARIDILKKSGNSVELIEVKAKSFDVSDEDPFFSKRGKKRAIRSEWKPYLLDVAFQVFVARKIFPKFKVSSYLMLADKSKKTTVDGLNQLFLITRDAKGRSKIIVKEGISLGSVGEKILCKISVDEAVDFLIEEEDFEGSKFGAFVDSLSKLVASGEKHPPSISTDCKHCEYRIEESKLKTDQNSGFLECFSEKIKMKPNEYARPMVFDIWNFRKSKQLMDSGCYFMDQVQDEDVGAKDSDKGGLSTSQRQLLQIDKVRRNDSTPFVDIEGIRGEFKSWRFPLHFIDFETTLVAIPFHKNRRPYEQIAFQFSHHTIYEDGSIEHKSQYIHRNRGEFPNFDFVRALREALNKDDGTIFRYAHHENSVLCQIIRQLEASDQKDKAELIEWIKTITTGKDDDGKIAWEGSRSMVDMCEMVKRYYYSPSTKGSNSIKKVLPAVLEDSEYLAEKYSKPIYGTNGGIKSLNFDQWTWLHHGSDGKLTDPYRLLPPIFSEAELEIIEPLVNSEEIADGGSAMMAYAMMQFTQMSDEEATRIQDALLKYCELDTLAMVMIYEYWRSELDQKRDKPAA